MNMKEDRSKFIRNSNSSKSDSFEKLSVLAQFLASYKKPVHQKHIIKPSRCLDSIQYSSTFRVI